MDKSEILKLASASLTRRFGGLLRHRTATDDFLEQDSAHQISLIHSVDRGDFPEQPWHGHVRRLVYRAFELGVFMAVEESSDHTMLSVCDQLVSSEQYLNHAGIACGMENVKADGAFDLICYADYQPRLIRKGQVLRLSSFTFHDLDTNFPFNTARITVENQVMTGLLLYGRNAFFIVDCHFRLPVAALTIHGLLKKFES